MNRNSLMICSNVSNSLSKLNEAEGTGNAHKYILQGVFAELGKKNRNDRIYTKDEYLRHLQYLRNDIKSGEPLLGELDHPDDRFEVKLKEASHRIVDLWYDDQNNVVMGKIELLDTPNGKIAQSMVEQGIPLHISSRAAGVVNNDRTVSIQQIYTYDLVAKPGFAGAVLQRVNESADEPAYDNDIKSVLGRMEKSETLNEAAQYGFLNEDISISEITAPAVLRKEAKEIQINRETEIDNNMTQPLTEQENLDPTQAAIAASAPAADASTGATATPGVNEGDDNNDDDEKKGDEGNDGGDSKDGDDNGDDKGIEIKGIEPIFGDGEGDDDVDIKDVKPEDGKDEEGDDKDKDEKDGDGSEGNEENERSATPEPSEKNKLFDDKDGEGDEKSEEDKKKEEEEKKKADEKAEDEGKKLGDRIDKFSEKMDKHMNDIKDAIKKESSEKKDECTESVIMSQYPVSMMMTESNFAAFAALSESQKNKVISYLQDTKCFTREAINENWKKGIDYVDETPVWLKFAPESYKNLYENASEAFKKKLAITAKYFLFESQRDIDVFWENSGIDSYASRKLLNESFVNNLPKVAPAPKQSGLPYSSEYIKMIGDMASEYNN